MKIDAHILCWNEAKLVPYVMDYWKAAEVDKIYVYDNGSTDGSVELLSKYPNVEISHFDSNGGYTDEFRLTDMRNNVWKKSKGNADWVIVCDFDEVPWAPDGLKNALQGRTRGLRTKMHQLVSDYFPEYDPGKLLHQADGIRFYDKDTHFDKALIFPLANLEEINFELGSHHCHPRGVTIEQYPSDVSILHLKYIGRDYTVDKAKRLYDNLRPDIREDGMIDWHYKKISQDYENLFKMMWENSYLANG